MDGMTVVMEVTKKIALARAFFLIDASVVLNVSLLQFLITQMFTKMYCSFHSRFHAILFGVCNHHTIYVTLVYL